MLLSLTQGQYRAEVEQGGNRNVAQVTLKQLLEAGVHFGHQTSRWNPKMRTYISTARNGIHIIDLQKTVRLLDDAWDFTRSVAASGRPVRHVLRQPALDGRHADQLQYRQEAYRAPSGASQDAAGRPVRADVEEGGEAPYRRA